MSLKVRNYALRYMQGAAPKWAKHAINYNPAEIQDFDVPDYIRVEYLVDTTLNAFYSFGLKAYNITWSQDYCYFLEGDKTIGLAILNNDVIEALRFY